MVFKFSDSKYQNEDDLLKKIDEEPIVLGADTHTDRALKMARDELFTTAGGDRPGKDNLLIVLTDGEPYWGKTRYGKTRPSKENFKETTMEISEDFEVGGYVTFIYFCSHSFRRACVTGCTELLT